MPPPIGSMRITSAPICAIVMPPSGAATKALISTMRRSASNRFIAAPPFCRVRPIEPKPGRRGNRSSVLADIVLPRAPHGERQHCEGKDRQQMDRAERPPHPDRVDEERTQDDS